MFLFENLPFVFKKNKNKHKKKIKNKKINNIN
jgi:hypothetical protein